MKQRVKEMEEEAAKLREMQAAAQAASDESAEAAPMETDEDRAAADGRSVYVGNVRPPSQPHRSRVSQMNGPSSG
jgi:hypothetical protein